MSGVEIMKSNTIPAFSLYFLKIFIPWTMTNTNRVYAEV